MTGSIAWSAKRQYISYLEADFEVFRPAVETCCTDGGEIWHGEVDVAKFHLYWCNNKGIRAAKLRFVLRFYQNSECRCPAEEYPLRNFHEICRVCTSFQDALTVKILMDLLKELRSYGDFKLRGLVSP